MIKRTSLLALLLLLSVSVMFAQRGYSSRPNRIISTDYNECLTGVKDSTGKWVIPPRYEYIYTCGESDFTVYQMSKQGILDSVGNVIIPIQYDRAECTFSYSQEYYTVRKDKKYGVLHRSGKVIVPCEFRRIEKNADTTFSIEVKRRTWFIYHRDGSRTEVPWKSRCQPYTLGDGYYQCRKTFPFRAHKYGMFDSTGKVIFKRRFHDINRCHNQNAVMVEHRHDRGYYTLDGKPIWPMTFDTWFGRHRWEDYYWMGSSDYSVGWDGIGAAAINGKYGLFNLKGDTVLPFIYDFITRYGYLDNDASVWEVNKGNEYGIYEVGRGWIVPVSIKYMRSVNTFYQDSDSSFVGMFTGYKDGKAGMQTTEGEIIIPFAYSHMNHSGGIISFVSKDSVVQVILSTEDTRNRLMAGADTMTEEYYGGEKDNYPTELIPDSGRFSVYSPSPDRRLYYHPGHLNDTLYHPKYEYAAPMDKSLKSSYPNEMLNASVFEIRTYYPKWNLPDSAGMFYEYVSIDHDIKPDTNRFVVYEYHEGGENYLWLDRVDFNVSDSAHTYYVTQNDLLFRNDGKVLIRRTDSYAINHVNNSVDGKTYFKSSGFNGQKVIDGDGNTIIAEKQNQDIGIFNGKYAWVNTTPHKKKNTWIVIRCGTGETVFNPDTKSRDDGRLLNDMIYDYNEKTGWWLYNLSSRKMVTTGFNEMNPIDDSGNVFLVRNCAGHVGLMDRNGAFIADTTWNYYTPMRAKGIDYNNYWGWNYWYQSSKPIFYDYIVLYNDSVSAIYDGKNRKMINDHNAVINSCIVYSDTLFPTSRNYRYGYGYNYSYINGIPGLTKLYISPSDSASVLPWHKECLFDSLFTRQRTTDEHWRFDRGYGYFTFYSCKYCKNQKKNNGMFVEPNNLRSSYKYRLHYADDSLLSFTSIKSDGQTKWISNVILTENGPQVLTMDSLFNPYMDWRNFVINTVLNYVNTHLYVRGDCHNPAGIPSMLNQRFMISSEGIELYPAEFYENGKQLMILIPWKDADPYLQHDIKSLMPGH